MINLRFCLLLCPYIPLCRFHGEFDYAEWDIQCVSRIYASERRCDRWDVVPNGNGKPKKKEEKSKIADWKLNNSAEMSDSYCVSAIYTHHSTLNAFHTPYNNNYCLLRAERWWQVQSVDSWVKPKKDDLFLFCFFFACKTKIRLKSCNRSLYRNCDWLNQSHQMEWHASESETHDWPNENNVRYVRWYWTNALNDWTLLCSPISTLYSFAKSVLLREHRRDSISFHLNFVMIFILYSHPKQVSMWHIVSQSINRRQHVPVQQP